MLSKPSVSVVVIVLNGVNTIRQTFESVMRCDKDKVELIVIDGGSSDGTLEVIKSLESDIAYFESGIDTGISDAFNRGIMRSSGEYVAILNSDDYWCDNALKSFHEAYNGEPLADIYYGSIKYIDQILNFSYIKKPKLNNMKYRMNVFHPAMFVKRSAYKNIGPYKCEYLYAMDSEWCHRALKHGAVFSEIPNVIANMRLGGRSDNGFRQSLMEYRQSTIAHGLNGPMVSKFVLVVLVVTKTILQIKFFRRLKYLMSRLLIKWSS